MGLPIFLKVLRKTKTINNVKKKEKMFAYQAEFSKSDFVPLGTTTNSC